MYGHVLSFRRPRSSIKMPDSLAVRVALRELPDDIQHKIMCTVHSPPPAPRKAMMSKRLQGFVNRWKDPERPRIIPRVLF